MDSGAISLVPLGSWSLALRARQVITVIVCTALLIHWTLKCLSTSQSPYASDQKATHFGGSSGSNEIGKIEWSLCDGERDLPGSECGTIVVPLDYFDHSAGVAKIALGRYNATSMPRKGIVLINPGGPGAPGKPHGTIRGRLLQQLIGPEYDIVGFDPRGIGETLPKTQCFPSRDAQRAFKSHTVLERGYDVGPNLTDPSNREHLIRLQREADALYKVQFEICKQKMGELLRYMGTSTVARDVDFISNALEGEDALINFHGGSYGSVLGQYLVNMFPDRVGRVVIDGIVDAVLWSNEPYYKWYAEWLSSSRETYNLFATECSKAGYEICALARDESEGFSGILARIEDFIARLYQKPLSVPDAAQPGILTAGMLRRYILEGLEAPLSWPTLAEHLSSAIQGNGTAILSALQTIPSYFYDLYDLSRSAVSCNDNKPFAPPSAQDVVDELLKVEEEVAPFAFAAVISEPDAGCQFWPVNPPERFGGPWNHTLRNPILIVSNTADPVTPIASGRMVNSLLSNSSRLLVQNSPGHTSFALPSLCTVKHVRAYFRDGTLPPDGTVCQPDVTPFEIPGSSYAPSDADYRLVAELKQLGRRV
ncbi:hypothetical protein OBBRIDRAFT_797713 [Obba rivulosa]|uniref:Uncharacterized protein n=1 Tax=Obba rivulosa TaxID=1052685 RepID=A0A8E2AJU6_9APHY|nr:hypothetical protein OBBRIDRAFT_797713 [Obba rivulosa]